ncbi:ASCH domain-containing protein [Aeromicrobium duanguangcaii]|uniref:ASCH domain-containing protein n=1 Tax=Aeromicrobium duanguangcaii TaxID=2968086 RepID=A0ABY5KGI6_9ACTN|nr:ASCH domain-containing protein [Aeromicrobium duanguangcaii]MCD9153493.1 ASCH domain-containing protein [Aeromicrobium duanguangcaii]UUI69419.1 ASCH domain-containing protein [Aeromicrobium duanguangcaii]
MSWPRVGALRGLELGTPGRMRERLNGLVLSGRKQATAGLLSEYEVEGEELEHVGERLALLDDLGDQISTVEITDVQIVPFIDVPWEFAAAEGEGDADLEEWRDGHRAFWTAEGTPVEDDTAVVCLWFVLV